jgi:tetratricopeptide (TPR) repeat protein
MRLLALLLAFACYSSPFAQPGPELTRDRALAGLEAKDAETRMRAIAWIAAFGGQPEAELLLARLTDEDVGVRKIAERGLWLLWGRSGDDAIDALMSRGIAQLEARRLQEAIAIFSEVIRRKPDFAEAWNKRATVLYMTGDYARSLADCDEVLKRNPYHFGALAGYGQIYFQLRQYHKALSYWKRALRVNPNMSGVEMSVRQTEELLSDSSKGST